MTRCCVPNCSETATHQFPKDNKVKKLWLNAIRRVNFIPKASSKLCRNHFNENDYESVSKYTGLEYQHKFLKKSAVPSVFSWNVEPVSKPRAREYRISLHNCGKNLLQEQFSTSSSHESNVVKSDDINEISEENVVYNVNIWVPVEPYKSPLVVPIQLDQT